MLENAATRKVPVTSQKACRTYPSQTGRDRVGRGSVRGGDSTQLGIRERACWSGPRFPLRPRCVTYQEHTTRITTDWRRA